MKDLLTGTRATLNALENEYWSVSKLLEGRYPSNVEQFKDMLYLAKIVGNMANAQKLVATLQDMPTRD